MRPGEELESLASGEVHVYCARSGHPLAAGVEASFLRMLGPEERERHGRLRRAPDRDAFLLARVLLRRALSRYAPVEPARWVLAAGRGTRPRISGPAGVPPLAFSSSRTAGFTACAVALGRAVGVDVESLEAGASALTGAARALAPAERAALDTAHPEERAERFLRHWTLKEAYLKARGVGLSLAPELVAFELGPGGPVRFRPAPGVDVDPARWAFFQSRPFETCLLATAVDAGGGPAARLRTADGSRLLEPSPG